MASPRLLEGIDRDLPELHQVTDLVLLLSRSWAAPAHERQPATAANGCCGSTAPGHLADHVDGKRPQAAIESSKVGRRALHRALQAAAESPRRSSIPPTPDRPGATAHWQQNFGASRNQSGALGRPRARRQAPATRRQPGGFAQGVAASSRRTSITGTGLWRTTSSASLPSVSRRRPRRPWVPITIRSQSRRAASDTIVSATEPPVDS